MFLQALLVLLCEFLRAALVVGFHFLALLEDGLVRRCLHSPELVQASIRVSFPLLDEAVLGGGAFDVLDRDGVEASSEVDIEEFKYFVLERLEGEQPQSESTFGVSRHRGKLTLGLDVVEIIGAGFTVAALERKAAVVDLVDQSDNQLVEFDLRHISVEI